MATGGCGSGLEQQEQPFVLAVTSDEPLWAVLDGRWGQPRADAIAAQIPADAWQRLSAGDGAKGPRLYEWARCRLARLQLSAEERRWEHWLLVRRSLQRSDRPGLLRRLRAGRDLAADAGAGGGATLAH